MRKRTTIKFSLFTFISTIICLIGNVVLQLDFLSYLTQGLSFLAYLFFLIWLAQIIYERSRFAVNIIIMFMSFALSLYSLLLFALLPYEQIFEYYVLFFYFFALTSLFSAIILVGRIIFYSPKQKPQDDTPAVVAQPVPPQEAAPAVKQTWVCACGTTNSGNFCSECGKAMPQ